jgi:hypothetical protein
MGGTDQREAPEGCGSGGNAGGNRRECGEIWGLGRAVTWIQKTVIGLPVGGLYKE